MSDVARLAEIFRRLGARDPEGWARSEVDEGIAQLARFLFLRGVWRAIVADGDTSWITAYRRATPPDAPCAGIGPALDRVLAAGIDPADLTEIVRVMQYEVAFRICYLLDDPVAACDDLDVKPTEVSKIGWRLFEVDDDERIGRDVGGLHESMLETDPTGREMRPRRRDADQ